MNRSLRILSLSLSLSLSCLLGEARADDSPYSSTSPPAMSNPASEAMGMAGAVRPPLGAAACNTVAGSAAVAELKAAEEALAAAQKKLAELISKEGAGMELRFLRQEIEVLQARRLSAKMAAKALGCFIAFVCSVEFAVAQEMCHAKPLGTGDEFPLTDPCAIVEMLEAQMDFDRLTKESLERELAQVLMMVTANQKLCDSGGRSGSTCVALAQRYNEQASSLRSKIHRAEVSFEQSKEQLERVKWKCDELLVRLGQSDQNGSVTPNVYE